MTCTNLRRMFDKYPSNFNRTEQNEWLHSQQDTVDVVAMLEHIFNVPARNIFQTGFFSDGSKKKDERTGLIGYTILPYMLQEHTKFSDIYPNAERKLKKSDFLYIQIYRNVAEEKSYTNQRKLKNPFTVPIEMEGMQLVSAIIHIGGSSKHGHYVAMLKISNTQWLYYDDLAIDERMGEPFDASQLFTFKNGILKTNGIGYLYIPI